MSTQTPTDSLSSTTEVCLSCRRPKARQACECCGEPVCKDCEQFLREGTFSFLSELPAELKHTNYCTACHTAHVEPALEEYAENMEQARQAFFFYKTQKRTIPVLKRSREVMKVEACEDRDQTILRLAFRAVLEGFNAVIEADVDSDKIRKGAYQTTHWRGVGVGALVDRERLERNHWDD